MTTTSPMKSLSIPHSRLLGTAALALGCWLAMPQTTQARDHNGPQFQTRGYHNNRASSAYLAIPSAGFALTFGTGYAGRGYYYGPPNSSYYYQRPGVMYYATRDLAPREYYGQSNYGGNSMGASVQSALARRGYYRGYIDGQIGPQSSRAIANYQAAQGLRVTGNINSSLLRSLGL
jgi:hypothetical protein